jgi:hypothetical protein
VCAPTGCEGVICVSHLDVVHIAKGIQEVLHSIVKHARAYVLEGYGVRLSEQAEEVFFEVLRQGTATVVVLRPSEHKRVKTSPRGRKKADPRCVTK